MSASIAGVVAAARRWQRREGELRAGLSPRALFALGLLAAATLYLTQLGRASLWYDEAGTTWMAELPLARLVAATAADTHPPLYLLVAAGEQRIFGSQPWAMRLPSVLFVLAALHLAWLIGRELGLSRAARLIGLGLLVLSPFELHFAQEARMYALFQAEILLALLGVLRRRWWVTGLALTAALWTHNYALIYAPVLGALAFWQEAERPMFVGYDLRRAQWQAPDGGRFRQLLACFALPALSFAPWLLVLRRQMATVAGGYWIQPLTPGSVVYVAYTWLFGFTLPEWLQPTGALVATGLLAWLVVKVAQVRERRALVLAWVALAPLALAVVASLLWKPILLFRGLAPSVPLLFLLTGWALGQESRPRRWYGLVLLVPLLAAAVVGHYLWNPQHKDGSQQFAGEIRAQWQLGDAIVHVNSGTMLEMHQPLAGFPQFMLPRQCPPDLGALSPATEDAMGMPILATGELAWRRIWFVWSWAPTSTRCEVDAARAFLGKYPGARRVFAIRNDDYVAANIWLIEGGKP